MALIDRIKYDGPPDILVWKYPKENLVLGSQLIVNESQEALFFKGGQALDLFGPGTHTLSTKNLPVLQKLVNLPFGGETPFTAEIVYVNRVSKLDYKWGTRTPLPVEDPKYRVLISIGCFGQFGLRVSDSQKFITQIVGTLPVWEGNAVLDYFRGVILTHVKAQVAKFLVLRNISIASITAFIDDLSQLVEDRLREEFGKYGLELLKFFINSITIPEDELAKLQKGSFERLEIDQIGDERYQMKRSLEVMEAAASNPGATGTLMGGGIGLGLGMQMAGAFQQMGQGLNQNQTSQTPPRPAPTTQQSGKVVSCSQCKAIVPEDTKFCNQCGAKIEVGIPCSSCGITVQPGSKFCPSCGSKIITETTCPACGVKGAPDSKFCNNCGAKSAAT